MKTPITHRWKKIRSNDTAFVNVFAKRYTNTNIGWIELLALFPEHSLNFV